MVVGSEIAQTARVKWLDKVDSTEQDWKSLVFNVVHTATQEAERRRGKGQEMQTGQEALERYRSGKKCGVRYPGSKLFKPILLGRENKTYISEDSPEAREKVERERLEM